MEPLRACRCRRIELEPNCQPLPGQDKLITFQGENGNLAKPHWPFRPRGQCGRMISDLLPHLAEFSVIGIDIAAPKTDAPIRFVRMDLGVEDSCRGLYNLFKETRPFSVVHLAFVIDPSVTVRLTGPSAL